LESDWVNLEVADVELPDGRHLTTTSFVSTASPPRPPSATTRAECCCCGDTGSSPTAGAGSCHPAGATQVKNRPRPPVARILEETGWAPGPLTLLCAYGADVGIGDARFHLYQAAGATLKGPPADTTEAARVAWIPSARFVNCLIGAKSMMARRSPPSSPSSRSHQSAPRRRRPRRCRSRSKVAVGEEVYGANRLRWRPTV
jgi:hypothetical protein